jgi:excisionase family DNA binding protein
MDDRWLSVDEIAVCPGVSKDTVYTWATGKGLPGHRTGTFLTFKKDEE